MRPRTKLVTFRLSEEEYEHLRAVSEARGARSVSEFVRSSLAWILENCERQLWEVVATSGQRAIDNLRPPADRLAVPEGKNYPSQVKVRRSVRRPKKRST
jgi:hypothetical protein